MMARLGTVCRIGFRMGFFVTGLSLAIGAGLARSETCVLSAQHVGMTFAVDQIEADWTCRLSSIIGNYTTANKLGPVSTPLPESVYLYLLDHPVMTAALVNRLGIAPYQSESRGPARYWGNDGEGTEGIVQLLAQDRSSRIYYLEGSHDSLVLRRITGKGVVLLKINRTVDSHGMEVMESTLVSYTRLDNRFFAGIASLFRPLAGRAVTKRLMKGVESVNRLSQAMRQEPDRVLSEAMKLPALLPDELIFLKQVLASLDHSGSAVPARVVAP
ncbi:MAG: hypothetical protein OEV08_04380 [Nitrospira sp.]|nr:hypothetical protein [Nitrospira sp.]